MMARKIIISNFTVESLTCSRNCPLPVFAPPRRITSPAILTNQANLDIANVGVQMSSNGGSYFPNALMPDFTHLRALALGFKILVCDFVKGLVENRNFVLNPKPHVRVMVIGAVPCFVQVVRFEGNRFIAVCLRQLNPAIPIPMFYIAPAEDNQARF